MADGMRTEGSGLRTASVTRRKREEARAHIHAHVRIALVCHARVKRTPCAKRERETASATRQGKSAGGGAFHKSIPTLNPACVPAVHDARNVSPTDPNPMDDIAAARTEARHMSSPLSRAPKR